jgi:hypothetical protein
MRPIMHQSGVVRDTVGKEFPRFNGYSRRHTSLLDDDNLESIEKYKNNPPNSQQRALKRGQRR